MSGPKTTQDVLSIFGYKQKDILKWYWHIQIAIEKKYQ